jgi:hypothetical protein
MGSKKWSIEKMYSENFREKKYICGNFMEVEVFIKPDREKTYTRSTKVNESTSKQKNLNDKKAKRYFVRLIHLNFTEEDLAVDLTYDKENIPETRDEIIRDVKNYVARLRRARRNAGLPSSFRYVYVISNTDNNGNKVRYHVHMYLANMDRDQAEKLWGKGMANTDRLQFNEHGVEGKSIYMANQAKGDRSWGSSVGLLKPEPKIRDGRLKPRHISRMENNPEDRALFERLYPEWIFTDCTVDRENDEGEGTLRFLVKMRRYPHRVKGKTGKGAGGDGIKGRPNR